MRPSSPYLILTAVAGLFVLFLLFQPRVLQDEAYLQQQVAAETVRQHGLTDLCLFTEARYTRHPAMADYHAPFQDHPLALEHFPSGSLVAPPTRPLSTDGPAR